jgi:radical SAM protein with 4Fe4S-binding SPASM domain
VWATILDKLAPDIASIRITGGECTLHPEFESILTAIDGLGVPFAVFTNGRWKEPAEVIARLRSCQHLSGVLISLHGDTPESYAAFVGTDSFTTVTHNIACAARAGVRVGTNTVLSKANVERIDAIAQYSLSLGAQSAAFSRYYGAPIDGLELAATELRLAISHIAALRRQDPRIIFNNCVPLCFSGNETPTKGCTSGFTHCTIDPVGNVRPCTHSRVVLGNILISDIAEIWRSDALRQWRGLVADQCLGCAAFNLCRGGCRATAHQRGAGQDPLLRGAVTQLKTSTPTKLRLYANACPTPNYLLRTDDFGLYLINRNCHIAVSKDAQSILERIDGQTTLAQIQSIFGSMALNFIGSLALHGLVYFSNLSH